MDEIFALRESPSRRHLKLDVMTAGEMHSWSRSTFNLNCLYCCRICVEAVLPKSSLFHAQVLCSREPKETRHVQGISHWAPSCIGPYSQAAKVGYGSLSEFIA